MLLPGFGRVFIRRLMATLRYKDLAGSPAVRDTLRALSTLAGMAVKLAPADVALKVLAASRLEPACLPRGRPCRLVQ
jgi:hypothetical protein